MNRSAATLALLLLVLPLTLISYRVISYGYPLFPAAPETVWQLSLDARIEDGEAGTTVMIGLPSAHKKELMIHDEKITEGTLDFSLFHEGQNRFGIWYGTVGPKGATVSYRATLIVRPGYISKAPPAMLEPYPEGVDTPGQALAERLVSNLRRLPLAARLRIVAAAGADSWDTLLQGPKDLEEWSAMQKKLGRVTAFLVLLRAAELNAHAVEGLMLEEGITSRTTIWIEVWTGSEWETVQPGTGVVLTKPVALLPLTTGPFPAVRTVKGEVSDIRWTLSRQIIRQWRLHFERSRQSNRFLDRWSLLRLPPEYQETFRILLLVPIGALLICILRNVIGFPTFGIFMPVLMALAFRNTGLTYGLGIFAAVVLIGYAVRHSIERLRLLLVPRLSVILTLVIACFTFFALLGNKLGVREFMAVGLLPFVILTMTIERFFVIMEEEGTRQGLRTAAGSAAVATITYEIIHLEPLQLTFFVYPELVFVVAAAQILLGRYTGYRLFELLRFRKMRNSP